MYYRENFKENEGNKNLYKNMDYPNYWKPGMSQSINDYTMMPFQYQNLYLYGTPEHYGSAHVYQSPFHYDNPYSNQRIGMIDYNCAGFCPFMYWRRIINEYW